MSISNNGIFPKPMGNSFKTWTCCFTWTLPWTELKWWFKVIHNLHKLVDKGKSDFLNPFNRWHPRAASHTRLKARVHCNLRALIGRKGGDHPSSLHTWRWRPTCLKKTSWIKSLHEDLHGGLCIRFHDFPELLSSPPPRGGPKANSRRPWLFFDIFFQHDHFLWYITRQIPW